MWILLVILLLLVGLAYGIGGERVNRQPVAAFDIQRYMGTWHEIARYDHSFERGLVEVRAIYRFVENGRVEVLNCGVNTITRELQTARGKAKTTAITGRLRVSFFWVFYTDYNVLELGEEYDWALVGSHSAKYLWILARSPTLPTATLKHILLLAEKRGYNVDKLLFPDPEV
ncbi:MAG: lipocalin family protein [Alistipes sp.]